MKTKQRPLRWREWNVGELIGGEKKRSERQQDVKDEVDAKE